MDKLTFLIDKADEGGYNAKAESESIFTQAETLKQLNLNIADAIACHFDDVILPGFVIKVGKKN